ncbi:methylenetetrahydrofolate reductase [Streptomyces sp. NPDC047002]|uniref:methylenetetrahydrofolate reductase n=1 Tax=Streptomyces sp. NPDC047002 TaxID=3155475 RepID=UPI003454C064
MAAEHRDAAAVSAAVSSLMTDFSLEVTPREVRKEPGVLAEVLPPGTRVYTTFLPDTPFADTLAAAEAIIAQGMRPVPHLAARNVADLAELDAIAGQLAQSGVREVLVIAGSLGTPRGSVTDSMEVLRSGILARHGIDRVGVAGHPEGNSDIGERGLAEALRRKNAYAADSGSDVYLLTQFCFAPGPIIDWEQSIRRAGNKLPVHVGLPGVTSPVRLLKYGVACGVGASLKVLRKQSGGVLKLATTPVYYPQETLAGIAEARADDPDSLLTAVHFFPFGSLRPTAAWARETGRTPAGADTAAPGASR